MGRTFAAYGETLWDMFPDGSVLGGAVFNLSYRLMSLGNDTHLVTGLGMDDLGKRTLKQIRDLGLPVDHIQMDPDHPTGTVDVYLDENRNPDYTINEDTAYDYIRMTEDLEELIQRADILCFGTLIQRNETSRRTLKGLFEKFRGDTLLYDINLRKKCFTKEIIKESLDICTILKLNEEELTVLGEMFSLAGGSIRERSAELITRFGLQYCVVTLGAKGLYTGTETEEAYVPAYKIELVDPVGAGDACAAGFLDCVVKGRDLEYACRFANALGGLVASQQGATGEIEKERVKEFMEQGVTGAIHPEFASAG